MSNPEDEITGEKDLSQGDPAAAAEQANEEAKEALGDTPAEPDDVDEVPEDEKEVSEDDLPKTASVE